MNSGAVCFLTVEDLLDRVGHLLSLDVAARRARVEATPAPLDCSGRRLELAAFLLAGALPQSALLYGRLAIQTLTGSAFGASRTGAQDRARLVAEQPRRDRCNRRSPKTRRCPA